MRSDHPKYMTKECEECNESNTHYYLYKSCNTIHLRPMWMLENEDINYLFTTFKFMHQIFSEVEKMGQGGYGTVFALKPRWEKWKDGIIKIIVKNVMIHMSH